MKEFILPYEVVRLAKEPDRTLMQFLQSTYKAAAECAGAKNGIYLIGTKSVSPQDQRDSESGVIDSIFPASLGQLF